MKGAMLNPRLRPLALGLAALLLAAPSGYADSVITSDGVQRHYEIFRSNNAKGPRPAVFLLHGGGSSAAEMRRYTGFDNLAEEAGIVAVYPQGIDKDWNAGAGAEDRFRGCAPGGALESIAIAGGTHSWPNARPDVTLPSIQTPPSRAIEANSEFWRFFARQPPLP